MKRVRERTDLRRPACLHVRSDLFSEALQAPPAGQRPPSLRSATVVLRARRSSRPYSQSSTVWARARLDGRFAGWSIA
jgi:hypothetical protein